jgi:outer membrane murein-binding lipoprotein Lpp
MAREAQVLSNDSHHKRSISPGEETMKNFKSILCASLLAVAMSSSALAGTISTTKAGTISTTKAGTISTTAADSILASLLALLLLP